MLIPENLLHGDFVSVFREWIDYRRTVLKRPLNEKTIERQLKKLSSWGQVKAINAINTSMDNQWQGLFEPHEPKKQFYPLSDNAHDQLKRVEKKEQEQCAGRYSTPREIADVLKSVKLKTI